MPAPGPSVFLGLVLAAATAAPATTTPAPAAAPAPAAPAGAFIELDKVLQRCEDPKLLKCLKLDKPACQAAITEAAAAGNASYEEQKAAMVAKGEEPTPNRMAWAEGTAMGEFMARMQIRSAGRFLACLKK